MTPKNTGFRPESLRLIAAALALHQAERIATSITPLPGTDRFIAIGTPAEVARLLEIAPVAQEVTQQAAESALKVGIAEGLLLCDRVFKYFNQDRLGRNSTRTKLLKAREALASITQQAAKAEAGSVQAAFEAWAKSVGNNLATDLETGGDVYVSGATRIAWGVWQARAALDQGAQAATTASASDQKPCGWLAGNSHDGGETMYCRREDAQRECDEYNTFERSQPDFDPESLRTPKPVYLAALARAPLPAQGCRWPTCESEKVQQEVADQAYRELYSGEQAQSVDDARDAARREAWLIANHRWSVRWRIHTKKQIEQWQMVDDGEPWGQWGNYRKVIDAAMRANDGAAEGGSQK